MVRLPRTLRTVAFGATALVVLIAPACITTAPRSPASGAGGSAASALESESVAGELVDAHNRIRERHRLPPLVVSGPLEAAAREHARDMARRRRMSHRGSDLSSPFRRMANQGYRFRRAGENVAAGYPSVDEVMRGWMRSPGHRRNILGKFSEIGAACAVDSDGIPYWCVTFGDPGAG